MKRIQAISILLFLFFLWPTATTAAASDKTIIRIGSDVVVEKGEKVNRVVAIGGQITVSGTVDTDILAIGESVVLTKTAVVKGDVTSLGGVIVIARDARVEGDLTEINSSNLYETLTEALSHKWEGWSWIFAIISLAIFLGIVVLALLIAALLPKPVLVVSAAIGRNSLKVLLCGILGLILIAPLALLLTISVVGIALIPLEVIFVVCSIIFGLTAVGHFIGSRFLRLLKRSKTGTVRETLWGLIILWLVGWVPYLGWMVKAIAIVIALGATLVSRFGTQGGEGHPPPAPAMTTTPGS